MAKKEEIKDLKRFISERGLTRSFTRYRDIRSRRKLSVDVVYDNYDGTQRRGKVYAIRSRRGTDFLDFFTLRVVGRTRLKPRAAIIALKTTRTDDRSFNVRGWSVKNNIRTNMFRLTNERTDYSYNETLQRTRITRSTNSTPKNKYGRVVVDATYYAANGDKIRVRAPSNSGISLWRASDRDKAINQAIERGSVIAGFSPIGVVVHNLWFEYKRDKMGRLTRIR